MGSVLAPAASAAQPERLSLKGQHFSFEFPSGSVCPFGFSLDFYRTEGSFFAYSDGSTRMAYTYWIRFSNIDSGNTRILHEAGSITFSSLSSTVVAVVTRGQELSLFAPGDLGAGQPGAALFITGSSREVDEYPGSAPNLFGFTTLSFNILSGSAENLCLTMA